MSREPPAQGSVSADTSLGFSQAIADRFDAEHRALALAWLERLREIVTVDVHDVFPSDRLLDHIPTLIREIGAYLRAPAEQAIAANTQVIAKAQELGKLRHEQQASVHQLLREYRLLGDILGDFVIQEARRLSLSPAFDEVVELMLGLQRAVAVLMQTTVDTFVGEYTHTIERQTTQLEEFNRLVSHELRQPLSALTAAVAVLRHGVNAIDGTSLHSVVDLVQRNVGRLNDLTALLTTVSRVRAEDDNAQIQRVELGAVAGEVVRQLKDMADARGVDIRLADSLPQVTVDVGRMELILINLVSNAIKYSDPDTDSRVVEIAPAAAEEGFVAIAVRDNGLGIDSAHLPSVFDRFYRAPLSRDSKPAIEGLGLGLAIVNDCVQSIGGQISVTSNPARGTTFVVTLPKSPGVSNASPAGL
jgi:signal transduction histidine kinase